MLSGRHHEVAELPHLRAARPAPGTRACSPPCGLLSSESSLACTRPAASARRRARARRRASRWFHLSSVREGRARSPAAGSGRLAPSRTPLRVVDLGREARVVRVDELDRLGEPLAVEDGGLLDVLPRRLSPPRPRLLERRLRARRAAPTALRTCGVDVAHERRRLRSAIAACASRECLSA